MQALADGADSVYLISAEDFDIASSYTVIHGGRDDLLKIMNAVNNDPRVVGKGVINPSVEVAADVRPTVPGEFEAFGFQYIPGYIKQQ